MTQTEIILILIHHTLKKAVSMNKEMRITSVWIIVWCLRRGTEFLTPMVEAEGYINPDTMKGGVKNTVTSDGMDFHLLTARLKSLQKIFPHLSI